jgi:eukaryotic-like serine/threonine-protein kinase
MTPERWRQIDSLFKEALECAPDHRAALLAEACAGDESLRREVDSLLKYHTQADAFLEEPAVNQAVPFISEPPTTQGAQTPVLGQRVRQYHLIEVLGQGGMGTVYLAEDTRLNRRVAIKFLSEDFLGQAQASKRLIREAQAAARLDHPNICAVHEVVDDESHSFIVMQYAEGKTLKEVIKENALDLKTVPTIAIQIADALAAAHEQNWVHLDIKPGNIMLTKQGQVKVLDFGIAKMLAPAESEATQTRTGALMGTPAYMSPEQAEGKIVDARSDIFAFGIVLYEMLTGKSPFCVKSKTPVEIMHAVMYDEPRSLKEINPNIGEPLVQLIERAMAKNPDGRFSSMREVVSELNKLKDESSSDSSVIRQAGNRGRATARWPNGKRSWMVASLAASILVGLMITSIWLLTRKDIAPTSEPSASQIKSLAILPFKTLNQQQGEDYLGVGMTDVMITRLSNLNELTVRPTSSVLRYRSHDPLEAGEALKVDSILDGSIQQQGDRVRVTVRLLRVSDGQSLWAYQCDEICTDIFALQDTISNKVTDALALRLTGDERERLLKRYTGNREAYEAYAKGRFAMDRLTKEDLQKAIEAFNKAVELDPSFALAWVGLAEAYEHRALDYALPREFFPKAEEAVEKALALDEGLGAAHGQRGMILFRYHYDWKGAEREFERAIELNPNDANIHFKYCWLLGLQGRIEEAHEQARLARHLNPLSQRNEIMIGFPYYCAHQFDKAIELTKKFLFANPNNSEAHYDLTLAYIGAGKYQEALAVCEIMKSMDINVDYQVLRGVTYGLMGNRKAAEQQLDEMQKYAGKRYVSPGGIGLVYASMGEKDKAFEWLEKGYEDRSWWMLFMKIDRRFDNLRSDPRFADLMRRVGFAP